MTADFRMSIEGPSPSEVVSSEVAPAYDEELDNTISVLHDLCVALAEDQRIKFIVEFAGERWPVDVWTDLCTVLEQLPDIPKDMGSPFVIDFYEQGAERTLHFEPGNGEIEVHCTSLTSWIAPDKPVRVPRETLRSSLSELLNAFVKLATAARPNIVRHPWFLDWRKGSTFVAEVR